MESPNAEYESLNNAFAFFSKTLFNDRLPPVLLTLRKHGRARGYYKHRAFSNRVQQNIATDEIALCVNTFAGCSDREILSVLVHEMVHLWQFAFGQKIPRRAYHNLEWARQMLEVGLHPSETGRPGGKMYGHSMSHFVVEGGPFDQAASELLTNGWRLKWEETSFRGRMSDFDVHGDSRQTRKKFVCVNCRMAAWAKFSARLICGNCGIAMV